MLSLESVFRLSVIVSMIDQLTGPMSRVSSSVDGSVSNISKLNQTFGAMAKTGLVVAGVGAQITDAVLSPVFATFETKRALGELKSMGVEDFAALESAAKSFSDTWAGTSKAEFLSAAVDIKGGIDTLTDAGVAQFAEIAGITAKATGATVAEMTSLFATGYGIYKDYYDDLTDMQFAEMFSAGLADAIKVFKASGSSMAASIQTLGASATVAQVPLEEQLTVLGMLQATMSGSEAGTKYRAFLQSAARAGKTLELSFTDANNQLLSMPEILATLRGRFGETLDAAEKMQLQKAFGTDEAIALIDLLYGKTGQLQDNILTLYQDMGQGIGLATEMANAINETTPDQYVLLKQQMHNLAEELGVKVLPTFNRFLGKTSDAISKVSEWVDAHPKLTKNIMMTVMVIGILLTVAGSLITVIGGLGLIFTKTTGFFVGFHKQLIKLPGLFTSLRIRAMYAGDGIRAGFRGITNAGRAAATGVKNVAVGVAQFAKQAAVAGVRAIGGLITSVWSFTAALLANPITWIVIGIVALIAIIVLLWQNWDRVTAWISRAWTGFINGIVAGFNWVRNLFAGMPQWLQIAVAAFLPFIGIPLLIINNWDQISAFFSRVWDGVTGIFTSGVQGAKDIITGVMSWFRESGAKVITTFTDGIKSVITAPADMVKKGLAKVRELLPFSDAHEGPLSQLTLSGRRVFQTIGTGMAQTADIPADQTAKAFGQMDIFPGRQAMQSLSIGLAQTVDNTADQSDRAFGQTGIAQRDVSKISLREVLTERTESTSTTVERDRGVTIEQLNLSVDLSKLKDLPTLFKLLREIEDYSNANGLAPAGGAV